MNGVIIDDEPLHEIAFKEACRSQGSIITTKDYRELCMGRSDRAGAEALAKKYRLPITWEDLLQEKKKIYLELTNKGMIPVPGLADALSRLAKNYRLSVGSSVSRHNIEYVLDKFKIRNFFQALVGRDEVRSGKPNPDIYLKAAERLGIAPAECAGIEDSLTGIKSVKNAGMICIGITTTHTADEMNEADAVIDSFDQLTDGFIKSLRGKYPYGKKT